MYTFRIILVRNIPREPAKPQGAPALAPLTSSRPSSSLESLARASVEHRWSIAGAPLVHRWSGRGLAGVLTGELLAALVELLRREAQAHHVLAAHSHSPCALTRTSRLALSLTLALALAWNLVCSIW